MSVSHDAGNVDIIPLIRILTVLGGKIPYHCSNGDELRHGELPEFILVSNVSHLCGRTARKRKLL